MQISSVNSITPIANNRHFPKWGTPSFDGENGENWKIQVKTGKPENGQPTLAPEERNVHDSVNHHNYIR